MPVSALYLRTRRPVDLGVTPGSTTLNRRKVDLLRRFLNVANGQLASAASDADYALVTTSTDPSYPVVGLAMSGGAGAVGATINGVTVTAAFAVSDTNSCGLAAAAINASTNALVQGFVTSNNLSATLTLTSVPAGATVDICGYRFTGTTGTPPTIVFGGNTFNFDISGSDTADATALAAAINAAPGLSRYVSAVSTTNVVRIFARQYLFSGTATFSWPTAPGTPANALISNAASIVASGGSLVASAFFVLNACTPGVQGNAITVAASGTGVSVVGGGARLAGGTGLNVVSIVDGT